MKKFIQCFVLSIIITGVTVYLVTSFIFWQVSYSFNVVPLDFLTWFSISMILATVLYFTNFIDCV